MNAAAGADKRYAEVHRVTAVGAWADLSLGVAKVVAGWFAQSQALIADGLHSLSDLATDVIVLVAAHQARAEADAEHPYGHERIETVATVLLGAALIVVGIAISYDAVSRLFRPEDLWTPHPWALAIAAISVVAKEALYQYTQRSAKRLRSSLLEANAWHHRSDAASSVVVIAGVGAALVGWRDLDAVAALIVAWMIAYIGFSIGRKGLRELIDTGLGPERTAAIRGAILDVDGVRDLHLLRTRQMGGKALVDVHILLDDPLLSVSEGHQISESVRGLLIARFDDVEDVTVHIDPEDDEHVAPGRGLGLRQDVLQRLDTRWAAIEECGRIRRVNLHFLSDGVLVEVEFPIDLVDGRDRLYRRMAAALAGDEGISGLRLLFSASPHRGAAAEFNAP